MAINNNILVVIEKTPDIIIQDIAERVKERRLESALTQKELAKRSGIPLPTYRRFERTGEISFRSLVMIGITLGMMEEFLGLFSTKTYSSMDNLLKAGNKKRQRGKRNG
ncbi:MAG: helix-turn-helix domain-containing protein [Dysgonamonadaceae bacterium]|jgi:transcriptional regulator with XRE-family HTH domain|nr:helix-turn-helix domain-containing protein [Dysgonamonadaceae bacterium]